MCDDRAKRQRGNGQENVDETHGDLRQQAALSGGKNGGWRLKGGRNRGRVEEGL